MALSSIQNVRYRGVVSCVPKSIISNLDCPPEKRSERERLVRNIGIEQRRICYPWQYFSDLAVAAAEKLLGELKWAREEVDALIVVTQSPDYLIPATAIIIQDRLKLKTSIPAFDINLGCSGYPYGLYVLGSMMSSGAIKKGLVLIGDKCAVLTEPLSAAVRAELGQQTALLTDREAPAHHLWFTADHRVLFTGADQKRPADRLRDQTLVQRTGQLMYELTRLYPAISGAVPSFGWDVPLAHPVDDVLYAGAHRNFPHQLFAFGTSHDPARAFLASRIILRALQGKSDKQDEHFSFARNL